MSRIGKLPVNLPAGVTVEVAADNTVSVKGPLGTLSLKVDSDITVTVGSHKDPHTEKDIPAVFVTRPTNQPRHRSLHGLYRALINNMVIGVSKGYEIKQELVGVGGMAYVYKGVDLLEGRTVAIKILKEEYAENDYADNRPCFYINVDIHGLTILQIMIIIFCICLFHR